MKIDLEKLKELANKAPKGPWHIGHINQNFDDLMDVESYDGINIGEDIVQQTANYLCAANPQTILKLIELIEVYRHALMVHSHHGELLDSEAYRAMAKGLRILGE